MAYAKLSNIVHGSVLVADGGFTCIDEGERLSVSIDEEGFAYVPCRCGRHYLNGQLNDADELIGLSKP